MALTAGIRKAAWSRGSAVSRERRGRVKACYTSNTSCCPLFWTGVRAQDKTPRTRMLPYNHQGSWLVYPGTLMYLTPPRRANPAPETNNGLRIHVSSTQRAGVLQLCCVSRPPPRSRAIMWKKWVIPQGPRRANKHSDFDHCCEIGRSS